MVQHRPCFGDPAANTFGNLTRNGAGIDGPGCVEPRRLSREALSAWARKFAEFRVDAFNVTNSLQPNNPNTTFGSATFGQITGASEPRPVRFGLRFVFERRRPRARVARPPVT